jgi:hypothetical protein
MNRSDYEQKMDAPLRDNRSDVAVFTRHFVAPPLVRYDFRTTNSGWWPKFNRLVTGANGIRLAVRSRETEEPMSTLTSCKHREASVRRPQQFQLHVECLCCGHENRLALVPGRPVRSVCSKCEESLYLVGPVSGHIIMNSIDEDSERMEISLTLFR